MGADGVEDGPYLGAVFEALLLDLLRGVGVDGFSGEAVYLDAHSEHLPDGGGGFGVAGPAALEPLLDRFLHRRSRHHNPTAAPIHHVRGDEFEGDEQP